MLVIVLGIGESEIGIIFCILEWEFSGENRY